MNLINKTLDKYEGLAPRYKALFEIIAMFVIASSVGILLSIIASYGLWMEMSIGLVVFGVFIMLKTMYDMRVAYYETLDKFKDIK